MSKSIRLSPKHGVNPSLLICPFCGESKGIALLGRLKNDTEAPKTMIDNYEPCDQCKENWSKGIALIRVTNEAPSKDAIPMIEKDGEGWFPTAAYTVISTDAAERIFDIVAPAGTPVLLTNTVFDKFMANAEAAGAMPDTKENE